MMKFLLTCLFLITTTSAFHVNDLLRDKIPVVVRLATAHNHQTPSPPLATTSRQTKGLNFDSCQTEQDCAGTRRCGGTFPDEPCTPGGICLCHPATTVTCTTKSDCDEGELCATHSLLRGVSFCVSEAVFPMLPGFIMVGEDGSSPGPQMPAPGEEMPTPDEEILTPGVEIPTPEAEIPTPEAEVPTPETEIPTPESEFPTPEAEFPIATPEMLIGQGKNFENCTKKQDCASDRNCVQVKDFGPCELGNSFCICIRMPLEKLLCNTSDECDLGESCANVKNADILESICVSDVAINSLGTLSVVDDNENM